MPASKFRGFVHEKPTTTSASELDPRFCATMQYSWSPSPFYHNPNQCLPQADGLYYYVSQSPHPDSVRATTEAITDSIETEELTFRTNSILETESTSVLDKVLTIYWQTKPPHQTRSNHIGSAVRWFQKWLQGNKDWSNAVLDYNCPWASEKNTKKFSLHFWLCTD